MAKKQPYQNDSLGCGCGEFTDSDLIKAKLWKITMMRRILANPAGALRIIQKAAIVASRSYCEKYCACHLCLARKFLAR